MKKLLIISSIASLFITNLSASMLDFGVGMEKQKISGYVKTGDTLNYFKKKSAETDGNPKTGNLGLKDKTNPYIWTQINFPLPFIPNIKAQYTKYHSTGHSNYIAGNVKLFDKVNIPVSLTNADTKLDVNSYDITAYYNIPIPIITLKLGAGADIWKGTSKIYDIDNKKTVVNKTFTVILPYVYGKIETPYFKGLKLFGTIKLAKAKDDHHYDYYAGLKYKLDIVGPVNPFLSIGYRVKDVKGVDGDTETKIKYKGAFAELGFSF